jgi:hypothetical protein
MIAVKTHGSVTLTPKIIDRIARPSAIAPTSPRPVPEASLLRRRRVLHP